MSEAEDRNEIQDVLYRYVRGVDRLDFDLIAACYFDDAIDNHGGYVGNVHGLIEDIEARHRTIESSQHLITNILIEFESVTRAQVESHCLVYLRQKPLPDTGTRIRRTIRARLVDEFERRSGEWRIAGRVVVFEEAVDEEVADLVDPSWVTAKRDRSDALYTARDACGKDF